MSYLVETIKTDFLMKRLQHGNTVGVKRKNKVEISDEQVQKSKGEDILDKSKLYKITKCVKFKKKSHRIWGSQKFSLSL